MEILVNFKEKISELVKELCVPENFYTFWHEFRDQYFSKEVSYKEQCFIGYLLSEVQDSSPQEVSVLCHALLSEFVLRQKIFSERKDYEKNTTKI